MPPVARAISRTQYVLGALNSDVAPDHSGEISGCFASAIVTSVAGVNPICDSPR